MWAGPVGLVFLVVAVRTLGETAPTFLQGDLALLHVDSLRAAGWHQLLGPYDRFGWHHPGPVFAYLISLFDRLEGFTRPLQAEALAALVLDGVSLTAAVAVARRHLGPGAAAGVLGIGWLAVVGLGNDAVFNPWPPTVVVLPTILLAVISVAALTQPNRSSAGATRWGLAVGALLVGTFCLQTDVGTLPLVAPCTAVAVAAPLAGQLVRRRRRRPAGAPDALVPGPGVGDESSPAGTAFVVAGAVLGAAAWIPVLIQEVSSHPGNLTRIVDFFRGTHEGAGAAAGVRAAGWAQLAVFGHRPPGSPPVGAAGSWATVGAVVLAVLLLGVASRRHQPVAVAGAAVWLAGTGLAVFAGTQIVGPPYSYLTYWAAAPLAGGAIAVGDLAAGLLPVPRRASGDDGVVGRRERLVVIAALVLAVAVGGDLLARRAVVSYSMQPVATAWSDVEPLVPRGAAIGVAYPNHSAPWAVGTGLVDRLEAGGHPVAVLGFWSNQVVTTAMGPPLLWFSVVQAERPVPATWRPVGQVGTVRLYVGSRPAPGTQ